jgi:SAM-dependent methyltransferase
MIKYAKINPGFWENPWYFAKIDLYKEIIRYKHLITGKVLDFGCGTKPFEQLFAVSEYIGLEHEKSKENTKADFFYDGKHFPFDDNSFDSVLSTQVLEHVPNPMEILNEIARVLKPGGYVMVSVPFSQEEHEVPYDFYRFSSYAIADMFNNADLKIIEYKKLTRGIKAIISTITFYIFRTVYRNRKRSLIFIDLLCTIFNLSGIVLSKIFRKDGDIYINNFVIAKKED